MIIWCASYPKSGNTWVRAIISSLLYTQDGIFNFNLLDKVAQFPSRSQFKDFTNDYLDYLDLKKICPYWISAQEKINSDGKLRIFKTHNGNYNIGGNDFTNKKNTLAAIYIVRDPRNMLVSISNHYQYNFNKCTRMILDEINVLTNKDVNDEQESNIINLLGSWKNHYNSWKIVSNSIIIKYEDLIIDPKSQIYKLSSFLNKFGKFEANDEKINNIIKTTSFERLKKKEIQEGFKEAASSNIKFFNLGPKNNWKDIVDDKLIYKIEKNFNKEMKELRYI